mmetsp:Transcript_14062/g.24651  ORF Transcript_14062/g.24651 Transcript_14062/m.24651 type:complete len:208 (+) Transcript_14062:257-880(+)
MLISRRFGSSALARSLASHSARRSDCRFWISNLSSAAATRARISTAEIREDSDSVMMPAVIMSWTMAWLVWRGVIKGGGSSILDPSPFSTSLTPCLIPLVSRPLNPERSSRSIGSSFMPLDVFLTGIKGSFSSSLAANGLGASFSSLSSRLTTTAGSRFARRQAPMDWRGTRASLAKAACLAAAGGWLTTTIGTEGRVVGTALAVRE